MGLTQHHLQGDASSKERDLCEHSENTEQCLTSDRVHNVDPRATVTWNRKEDPGVGSTGEAVLEGHVSHTSLCTETIQGQGFEICEDRDV